jgi:hypothetical protein
MVGHLPLEEVILVRVQVRQQTRRIATRSVPEVTELTWTRKTFRYCVYAVEKYLATW